VTPAQSFNNDCQGYNTLNVNGTFSILSSILLAQIILDRCHDANVYILQTKPMKNSCCDREPTTVASRRSSFLNEFKITGTPCV